jgi:hypothetical protein
MSELVANCPRCGSSKITFDLKASNPSQIKYDWQRWFEAFCICRNCSRSTVFVLSQSAIEDADYIDRTALSRFEGSVNNYMQVEGFISLKDISRVEPTEHLPPNILNAFTEGATCLAVNCFNAAGPMFRLCIDHATTSLLPSEDADGLNPRIRRTLGLRLPWLFDHGLLPEGLRELSHCIKEDGNDGAHAGTLSKDDVEDLLDFTSALLERLYTEPERLRLARERRDARRAPK